MEASDFSLEDFKPKCVKEGTWTGSVKLRLLGFDERFELLDRIRQAREQGIGFYRATAKELQKNFVAVDLERVKDGRQFKSYADLDFGADCHLIITEAIDGLVSGFRSEDEGNV